MKSNRTIKALAGSVFLLAASLMASSSTYALNCSEAPVSGKSYYIVSKSSGLQLDVSGQSQNTGADVLQWYVNGATNQQWVLEQASGGGSWTIRAVHSQQVLDVWGWNSGEDAPIKQYTYSGNANQQWLVVKNGDAFTITSNYSNKLLTVADNSAGTLLMQHSNLQGSGSQQWYFNPVDGQCSVPALPANSSAGCGSAAQLATGLQTITIDGVERSYWIEMPANYDPNTAYPLIVGLHWRGGSASEIYGWSGFFGLKNLYNGNAIFLAPEGIDAGWANTGDRDVHFMRNMISQVQQNVCTDTKRVFATGFSFGGMMSNTIGCQMGDVVRAVVPMAGSLWSGCADSSYKVAALFIHAKDDTTVPYSAGEEARDLFLSRNGCSTTTTPLGSNGCVEYQGCANDKPVVWCGTETGGHWYPDFSAQESKDFFDRFK